MNAPPPVFRYHPVPVLLCASAVVLLGTALIDPPRLWLLLIPFSFLVSTYGEDHRLNEFLHSLTPLFSKNGVFVFQVDRARRQSSAGGDKEVTS